MSLDSYISSNRARAEQAAKEAEISAKNAANEYIYKNAADYINETSNGGEAIQAAINDLPSKGGKVIIPAEGPDDNVTESGKQLDEDGVWRIENTINVPYAGVTIEGEAHGTMGTTQDSATGTRLLVPDNVSLTRTFNFDYSAGCSMRDMRIDGGTAVISPDNVDHHIELDGNDPDNVLWSFVMENMYLMHSNKSGIRVNESYGSNLSNIKIDNSTLTDVGNGAAVRVESIENFASIYITNTICSNVDYIVKVDDSMNGIFCTHTNASSGSSSNIGVDAFNINAPIDNFFVSKNAQFSFDRSYLRVESSGSIRNGYLNAIDIEGNSQQDHVIDNQGQISDFEIGGSIYSQGLNESKYVNVINDISNTTRLTKEGLGYNGPNNPSSAGDWNGNGREGVRVLWDNSGTPTISEYVNGTWYNRAL